MPSTYRYTSIEEFKINNPNSSYAMMAIYTSDTGDVQTVYYDGNYDRAKIATDVTSFVYVNDYKVVMQMIRVF